MKACCVILLLSGLFFWGTACTPVPQAPPRPPDPKQIQIPAGPAHLGSSFAEKQFGYSLDGPASRRARWFDVEVERWIELEAYAIDRFLVTQADYAAFVKATGHRVPHISEAGYQKQGFLVHPYHEVRPYLWNNGEPPADFRDHPVVLVSVDDARAYCHWRGQGTGRTYRLPTEDEWEKAARSTDHRFFPWGNEWDPTRANSVEAGPYRTTPVGLYPRGQSPYGVHDMAGNVFEWTQTVFRPNTQRFTLKSCSWDDNPGFCRAAARHGRPKASRHILIGFRCVSVPGEPLQE